MTWRPTVYRSQVTMAPIVVNGVQQHDAWRVWAIPHPLHAASVTRSGDWWIVRMLTLTKPSATLKYVLLEQARAAAGEIVGRKTGEDLARLFDGTQRRAMGQQQCPKRLGSTLCGEPAAVGTVWCMWHPLGQGAGYGQA